MDRCLEKLDISAAETITNWHERFELFAMTNDRIKKENKTAFYLTMVGKEAYDLLKDLAYPNIIKEMDVTELQELLQDHLRPVQFETTERAKFNSLVRTPGEALRSFLLRVQQSAAKCNFGFNLEEHLRDRIVAGVNDPEVQKKLLQEPHLTFKLAKQILESWDDVNRAVSTQPSEVLFNRFKKRSVPQSKPQAGPKPSVQFQSRPGVQGKPQPRGACASCGGSHPRSSCKFRQAVCNACQKKGHIARVCRSSQQKSVTYTSIEDPEVANSTPSSEVLVLTTSKQTSSHMFQEVVFESGKSANLIVDTGSPVSLLPIQQFRCLGFKEEDLRPSNNSIVGVSGHSLGVLGQLTTRVRKPGSDQSTVHDFTVTEKGPMVLGLDGLRALQVQIVLQYRTRSIPRPLATPHQQGTTGMSQKIASLVNDCSRCTGGMRIPPVHLETDSSPIFFRARPVAFGLRAAVKSTLETMVADGVLQPVTASAWATPIVTPLKSNGTPRVCGDFRVTVNPLIKQTAVTTLAVDDMFEGMSGCRVFSKLDLTDAFLQIPLDEESRRLTTINTMWGLFEFKFLPFGLTVSPGIFQQELDRCISGLVGVRAFQDDIVVHAPDLPSHNQRLLELLQVLKQHNIKINAKKSVFGVDKIKYLGYYLDGRGISPDVERIRAVKDAPRPTTLAELRSFLGFVQYYAKFVPQFAKLARPLFDLLAGGCGASLEWTKDVAKAYNELLEATINGQVLTSFTPGQYSELVVDASEYAIGGVLEQQGRPVVCISRRLTKSERNYSQTQKEALAVYWATKRLHKYLYGARFKIVTDHQALQHIFSPRSMVGKATSAMLQRWALSLGAYDYDIEYRKGSQIPQADYLSRNACHEEPGAADVEELDSFMVQPLPIVRNKLIEETRLAYGSVIASCKNGWSGSGKKRFPELYNRRNDLQLQADGVIVVMDRPLIPPSCRRAILEHLHHGHLGRDKMRSLAKLICWWPSINLDISTFIRACKQCQAKPSTHPTWKPWPVPFEPMQRIHADYCGPFLDRYYILVVEDAYSKFPEAFITTNATAELRSSPGRHCRRYSRERAYRRCSSLTMVGTSLRRICKRG